MSYSVSISGSNQSLTPEEGKAFEEGIVAKFKALLPTLEGVISAQGSFGQLGEVDLREEPSQSQPVSQ